MITYRNSEMDVWYGGDDFAVRLSEHQQGRFSLQGLGREVRRALEGQDGISADGTQSAHGASITVFAAQAVLDVVQNRSRRTGWLFVHRKDAQWATAVAVNIKSVRGGAPVNGANTKVIQFTPRQDAGTIMSVPISGGQAAANNVLLDPAGSITYASGARAVAADEVAAAGPFQVAEGF